MKERWVVALGGELTVSVGVLVVRLHDVYRLLLVYLHLQHTASVSTVRPQ